MMLYSHAQALVGLGATEQRGRAKLSAAAQRARFSLTPLNAAETCSLQRHKRRMGLCVKAAVGTAGEELKRGTGALMPDEAARLSNAPPEPIRARVMIVVPADAPAPFAYPRSLHWKPPTWLETVPQLARRLSWTEPGFELEPFIADDVVAPGEHGGDDVIRGSNDPLVKRRGDFLRCAEQADMIVFIDIPDGTAADWLARHSRGIHTCVSFRCGETLTSQARLLFQPSNQLVAQAASLVPWSQASRDAELLKAANELFDRHTPNDFVYMLLTLIDAAVSKVRALSVNKKTTLRNLYCMVKNCSPQIYACVSDPNCKAALDCLEKCGLNDQVCSYQCIVTYESDKFEAFTLCNLLKHNCLENKASVPTLPAVPAMERWRGEAVTHELAEQVFIGHLDVPDRAPWLQSPRLKWSWKVVCGQNPAYDRFPCQHQIFYYGKNKRTFWYDPVFQVIKLDGEPTWRKRHYAVRRGKRPGTFVFSVLDNGVTSLEYWRIVDVAEDMSWAVFFYSGAAEAAGQGYSGSLLVTADGKWPPLSEIPRIQAAHESMGIAIWELSEVDNSCCDGAPLDLVKDA